MTAPENAPASSATLAQQALEIYDARGEFAMLPFTMDRARPKDQGDDDHGDWIDRGYLLLDDGSDITHLNGTYMFGWHSTETGHQTHVQRHSAMPDDGRPSPTRSNPLPIIAWPHLYNAWESVMDIVEHRAGNEGRDSIITDPDVAYKLAPSLNNAIRRAITQANTSDYVSKYVDNISQDVANAAIEMMPLQELQALIDHANATGVKA